MTKPNPKNYDFLWLLNNFTYLETSLWLCQEFLDRDFIVTYKDGQSKTYIDKKERAKLSKFGLIFLQKSLQKYKKKVKAEVKKADSVFIKIKGKKIDAISNSEFIKIFLNDIKYFQLLWRLYFFTEYFLYDEIAKKIEEDSKENNELLKKIKEMRKLKFGFRKVLNKTIFKGNVFEKYYEEIKNRIKRKDLSSLHYKEIIDILNGKKIKIVDRNNFVLGKYNGWKPITGKQALKIIKSFDKIILQEIQKKMLKGQIANKGFYKGHVKIIPVDIKKNLTLEISKMKKGDVLVTGTTGPEMILACRKAGAIVTEEGGICSHAAIVSRELNVPCVIGTKIATQVLKDGDLIEVDANKGVVKIL